MHVSHIVGTMSTMQYSETYQGGVLVSVLSIATQKKNKKKIYALMFQPMKAFSIAVA